MNPQLTPKQQAMADLWERHMAAEFEMKSIDATKETMSSKPYVNHVPVMTGGVGTDEVRRFYGTHCPLGVLPIGKHDDLPVTGIKACRKVLDPAREPSSRLSHRTSR